MTRTRLLGGPWDGFEGDIEGNGLIPIFKTPFSNERLADDERVVYVPHKDATAQEPRVFVCKPWPPPHSS